jgi:hypothetical protein
VYQTQLYPQLHPSSSSLPTSVSSSSSSWPTSRPSSSPPGGARISAPPSPIRKQAPTQHTNDANAAGSATRLSSSLPTYALPPPYAASVVIDQQQVPQSNENVAVIPSSSLAESIASSQEPPSLHVYVRAVPQHGARDDNEATMLVVGPPSVFHRLVIYYPGHQPAWILLDKMPKRYFIVVHITLTFIVSSSRMI